MSGALWFGGKVSPLIAAFHALLFWFSLVVFCPILLWCLFDPQKRCLHDIFAGVRGHEPALAPNCPEAGKTGVCHDPILALVPQLHCAPLIPKLGARGRIRCWAGDVTEHKSNFPEFYITAPQPCPYLPGKLERKLFTHLTREKPGFLIDNLLKGGFRRSQNIAYMPYCDACSACVPVRILVDAFRPRRSLNRIARANRDWCRRAWSQAPSAEQYSLFRAYIDARHGDGGMAEMSVLDYSLMVEDSVVETCVTEYRLTPDPVTGDVAADRRFALRSLKRRHLDGVQLLRPRSAFAQPRHLYDP